MESQRDVRIDAIPVNRESTMAHDTPPTAGRRGAVRLLGLGMALLGALGLQTAAASPEPQSSQAEPELIGKIKTRRGKRGRKGRQGKHGSKGPGGEPGGGGPEGAEGPAGPSSGAFLGLVHSDFTTKVVPAGTARSIDVVCPAAEPGERIVAVSGGFDGSAFFVVFLNAQVEDTRWQVAAYNSNLEEAQTLSAKIVCARFTA